MIRHPQITIFTIYTVQSCHNAMFYIYRSIGLDCVISEPYYKGQFFKGIIGMHFQDKNSGRIRNKVVVNGYTHQIGGNRKCS